MAEHDDDEPTVSFADAAEIGFKIVEMADRVKAVAAAVPGAQATWAFESEDDRFEVTVKLAASAKAAT